MKTLVLIPARSGSKGIPKKNLKKLNGIPLISYTIELALDLFESSDICVSTDSKEIVKIAEQHGLNVPFVRPAELASDYSSMRDVILNALDYYKDHLNVFYDRILLLQPTSPFRRKEHIMKALKLYEYSIDMVVGVTKSKANPYFNLLEETTQNKLIRSKKSDVRRRQDAPKIWEINGAVYLINSNSIHNKEINEFENLIKLEMDYRSSIDIDQPEDWTLAEYFIKLEQD